MKQRMLFYASAFFAALLLINFTESLLSGWTREARPVTWLWFVMNAAPHVMFVHYSILLYRNSRNGVMHDQPDSN